MRNPDKAFVPLVAVPLVAVLLAAFAQQAEAANGRYPLASVGLWAQFERRGWSAGYYPGELIQNFNDVDPVVGHTYAEEASLQLDTMKALGVNRITYELRTADPSTAPNCPEQTFPSCKVCYVLGLDWPKPTAATLANLKALFDLVHSKGMTIDLLLITTHMDEASRTNSKTWLSAILNTVKGHPALSLILFGGDANTVDTDGDGIADACGSQGGEAPLWLGPRSYAGRYLRWAISESMSRGIPVRQLSAESVVGDFFLDSEPPAGPSSTDGHLWKPIRVMRSIFNALNVAPGHRTYAMSFYQRRKCSSAQNLTCTPDMDPHAWAEDRLKDAIKIVGDDARRSLIATEAGTLDPVDWPAERAFESLGFLMQKYGTAGATFWRWTSFQDSEDSDAAFAKPVKRRGTAFNYFPPKREIVDLGGYHLLAVPNGSFEAGGAKPSKWAISGDGTGARYRLADEPNQPQVPSRGQYNLRLVTGAGAKAIIRATSQAIAVDPDTAYTTTGNLRFVWVGDPTPGGSAETRPQVFVTIKYFRSDGQPSGTRASDTFRLFQEDGADDFQTIPVQYVTPGDAATIKIVIGAARNGLPIAITLDVDNLR